MRASAAALSASKRSTTTGVVLDGRASAKPSANSTRMPSIVMNSVASGTAAIDLPEVVGFGAAGDSILVQFDENGGPVCKPWLLKEAVL